MLNTRTQSTSHYLSHFHTTISFGCQEWKVDKFQGIHFIYIYIYYVYIYIYILIVYIIYNYTIILLYTVHMANPDLLKLENHPQVLGEIFFVGKQSTFLVLSPIRER